MRRRNAFWEGFESTCCSTWHALGLTAVALFGAVVNHGYWRLAFLAAAAVAYVMYLLIRG